MEYVQKQPVASKLLVSIWPEEAGVLFAEICIKQMQEIASVICLWPWRMAEMFHPVSEVTTLCWACSFSLKS